MSIISGILKLILSLNLALAAPITQGSNRTESLFSDIAESDFNDAVQTRYWAELDFKKPMLTEFALGDPLFKEGSQGLNWNIKKDDPLLDQNPYFLRGQSWSSTLTSSCSDTVCVNGGASGTTIRLGGGKKSLNLDLALSFAGEDENYVFLASQSNALFSSKVNGSEEPAQGLFYISKLQLRAYEKDQQAVPVFHFPLPGSGWLAGEASAYTLHELDTMVFSSEKDDYKLEVPLSEFSEIDNMNRRNLYISSLIGFIKEIEEGGPEAVTMMPSPNSTLAFGLMLNNSEETKLGNLKDTLLNAVLPKAHATENTTEQKSTLQKLRGFLRRQNSGSDNNKGTGWRNWITPVVLYGGTFAAAGLALQDVDWKGLITDDMPQRLKIVGSILGSVTLASITMRHTIHRNVFAKKYPTEGKTLLQRLNDLHKSYLDELAHGLYFSMAGIPQTARHILEFLKDRFISGNKIVDAAWDATMGFQMQQSSRLAMNWKTFYMGAIVFGMADATLVALDLLIFTPYLVDLFGYNSMMGEASISLASAMVMYNFLAYLQVGAFSYSAEVKFINLKRAQNTAIRQFRKAGKDPEDERNAQDLRELTLKEIDKIFSNLGLPKDDEFLYDPITVIESVMGATGFSLHDLKNAEGEKLQQIQQHTFVLRTRRWGLAKPTFDLALNTAKDLQSEVGTEVGENVVAALEWGKKRLSYLSLQKFSSITKKLAGLTVSSDYRSNLHDFIQDEINAAKAEKGSVNATQGLMAALKGSFKYLGKKEVQEARDIRKVLYLMSTNGDYKSLMEHLPDSWIEAAGGSKEAAMAAAQLLNKSFYSFYAHRESTLKPSDELLEKYGNRGERLLSFLQKRKDISDDEFTQRINHWELVDRIERNDARRAQILTHEVENELSPSVKAEVRKTVEETQDAQDILITEKWSSSYEAYLASRELSPEGRTDEDRAEWVTAAQTRLKTIQKIGKTVGLHLISFEDSEVQAQVIASSTHEAEVELNRPEIKTFLDSQTQEERELFETQIHYKHFVDNYYDHTVKSDKFDAFSPEFPGVFQRMRQKVNGKLFGKALTRFIKVGESLYQNDSDSFYTNGFSRVKRNVPLVADFANNFGRTLRIMPYAFTLGYLSMVHIWQISYPFNLFVFSTVVGFTGVTMIEINNRLMRNFNIKPMGSVPGKLTFSFIHSRLTNPLAMLEVFFAATIAAFLSTQNLAIGMGAVGGIVLSVAGYKSLESYFKKKKREGQLIFENGRVRSAGQGETIEGTATEVLTCGQML